MEALFKDIIGIYASLPPWIQSAIEVYFIPLLFIFLCVEGFKTLYKKNTKNKIDWRTLFFGPWVIGVGWVLYHELKQSIKTGTSIPSIVYVLDFISGIGLGLASNLTSVIFEKLFNRFKKEEKHRE